MLRLPIHWQILVALVLGAVAGWWAGPHGAWFGIELAAAFDFVGDLFLNALKMLVVPLIVSSLLVGISGLGGEESLGRMGGKTLLYYLCTSTISILIGLTVVNLIHPGIVDGQPAKAMLGLSADTAQVTQQVRDTGGSDVVGVFLRMLPPNIVNAAAQGQMLGLVVFSLLFGYFMGRIEAPIAGTLANFWRGVFEVMLRMTALVIRFAPLGVFALVAEAIAMAGFEALRPLAVFFVTVLLALLIHIAVVLPLILRVFAGVSPRRHYRAMLPALLTAFSTASSSGTLPVTLDCVQNNAGVSNRVSSFILPLGATINMDGTALYECVAAMFIAQAYGLDLTFAQQFIVVLLALMTSIGVAGVPAASLVAITIILGTIGLPAEAIGLILAVDRILDMCRTGVNVFGDSCGAVVIGRSEGEEDILKA